MRLADLDDSQAEMPVSALVDALGDRGAEAVLPARDQERGTAIVLVATARELIVAARADGADAMAAPRVALTPTAWQEVGIGPFGVRGRVPGGFLGGAEASVHLLTLVAGDRLIEGQVAGAAGVEAVEAFAHAARRHGARDIED